MGGRFPVWRVEIFSVELAVVAPGITEAGKNEHSSAAGRFEQERATADRMAPPTGMTETFALPVRPAGISIAVGVALRLIVAEATALQVGEKFTAFENWFLSVGLPTAST
jgi:hypothetical protein